ncbi:hypothetical protein DPMN_036264 [Dreissena polymorpha]|uniref:Uncharacterized protein n=1 Tax=Dreissena polymorpha TaxID=45954 RepID=A0A9D4MC85_DREPO|nr:hypothetical protein DPMN_036264 [Dreissena polymorpha]
MLSDVAASVGLSSSTSHNIRQLDVVRREFLYNWRNVDCTRNSSIEWSVHKRLSWTAYVTRWQSNGHFKEHYPAIFGPTELEQ